MPEPWQQQPSVAPQQAVAAKIQDLVAARLGRGFVPLGILFVFGIGRSLTPGPMSLDAIALLVGAPAAAAAMLAYGLRIVQRAYGRPARAWMSLAAAGSVVPLTFSVYVLGWLGLRAMAAGSLRGFGIGLGFALMGMWLMRTWMKLVEVERLARVMAFGLDEEVGRA